MYQPDYVCFASDHLLSVRKDGSARCWVPGCKAQREWKPMTMADHLYATHSIRTMCEPSDARRLLISENTSLLEMSEETREPFELWRLPLFQSASSSCRLDWWVPRQHQSFCPVPSPSYVPYGLWMTVTHKH